MKFITSLINTHIVITVVVVFVMGFAIESVWCRWMANVANPKPLPAANWNLLIGILGAVNTFMIVADALVPFLVFLVGGYLGTYWSVRRERLRRRQDKN